MKVKILVIKINSKISLTEICKWKYCYLANLIFLLTHFKLDITLEKP